MTKDEVVAALEEIGTLLELKGEGGFRARAYHNGARAVAQLDRDLGELIAQNKLDTIPGIGEALRDKITALVTTGRLKYLDDLRKSVPAGLVQLLRVPGLGPKKAKALYDEYGIDSVDKLREACERGDVAKLKGFGEKTQQRILEGVKFLGTVGERALFSKAYPLGAALLERVRAIPGVARAELVGSLRRRQETAGDVNLLATSENPSAVTDAFVELPEVLQVEAHEPDRARVVANLWVGKRRVVLPAELRVVSEAAFPAALVHLTGSVAHNEALARRGTLDTVRAADERAVYKALGLAWVPPELREGTGEIEAAEAGSLPRLIEASDVRGVFHNHTVASDGTATLEEMAAAAKALGYEYFGVADHSRSLTVANGLTPQRVREQWAEVDALNKKLKSLRILKGTECDILPDGRMDFDDEVLAGFDYVVASVHSHFGLDEAEQTERVCRALAHPAVTWLGHATGRLLLRRAGYKLDLERVLRTAAEHGKMIEINAQPDRLDLDWRWVKRAKELGIPLVINPDAHSPGELGYVPYGVNVARRGWLEAADVFNTRPLAEVLKELERRKAAWLG